MTVGAAEPANADGYISVLADLLREAAVSDQHGAALSLDEGFSRVASAAREAHARGNKIMFIGNGGSAAISSHMALDYLKNGGMRAMALNDLAALTALGNDFGYDQVFAKQLDLHARPGDLLVAISSSGRSANILNAVDLARTRECGVVTFSGFSEDNPLRRCGDVNFYIRSGQYGFVEVGHLALCHASFDIAMGWDGSS
jgi:D-sedoheptulose 7-phosphate isomerase